uniref:Sushi domain-containing protein n=1 Tax=Macrostomum lignano TaxID=282301 RepID=A0A1I8FR03_9PLAT
EITSASFCVDGRAHPFFDHANDACGGVPDAAVAGAKSSIEEAQLLYQFYIDAGRCVCSEPYAVRGHREVDIVERRWSPASDRARNQSPRPVPSLDREACALSWQLWRGHTATMCQGNYCTNFWPRRCWRRLQPRPRTGAGTGGSLPQKDSLTELLSEAALLPKWLMVKPLGVDKTSCDNPPAYSLGYLSSTVTYNSSDYIVDLVQRQLNFAPNSAPSTALQQHQLHLPRNARALKSQCRQGASGLSWPAGADLQAWRLLTKFDENLHPGSAISNEITLPRVRMDVLGSNLCQLDQCAGVCDEKSDGRTKLLRRAGAAHPAKLYLNQDESIDATCVKAPRPGYFNIHPTISIACKLWRTTLPPWSIATAMKTNQSAEWLPFLNASVYPPGSQVMVNCSAYTNELVSETIFCNDSGSWLLMQNSSGAATREFGEHIKCIQYSPCPRNESRLNASGLEILREEWSEWSNVTDNQQYLAPNASLIHCNYRVCESVFDQFPPLSTPRGMRTNMSDEWLPFYNASFYPPGSQVLVNCTTIQHLSQIIICNDTGNWVPVQLSKLSPSMDCRSVLGWFGGRLAHLRCPLSTATTNRLTWEDSALSCSDRVCPPVFDQLPQFSVATGLKLNQSAEWQPYFNSSIYPPGSQVMVNCTTDEQVSEIIFCNSTGDWVPMQFSQEDNGNLSLCIGKHINCLLTTEPPDTTFDRQTDIRPDTTSDRARHEHPTRQTRPPIRARRQTRHPAAPARDGHQHSGLREVETIADGTITRNETTITGDAELRLLRGVGQHHGLVFHDFQSDHSIGDVRELQHDLVWQLAGAAALLALPGRRAEWPLPDTPTGGCWTLPCPRILHGCRARRSRRRRSGGTQPRATAPATLDGFVDGGLDQRPAQLAIGAELLAARQPSDSAAQTRRRRCRRTDQQPGASSSSSSSSGSVSHSVSSRGRPWWRPRQHDGPRWLWCSGHSQRIFPDGRWQRRRPAAMPGSRRRRCWRRQRRVQLTQVGPRAPARSAARARWSSRRPPAHEVGRGVQAGAPAVPEDQRQARAAAAPASPAAAGRHPACRGGAAGRRLGPRASRPRARRAGGTRNWKRGSSSTPSSDNGGSSRAASSAKAPTAENSACRGLRAGCPLRNVGHDEAGKLLAVSRKSGELRVDFALGELDQFL